MPTDTRRSAPPQLLHTSCARTIAVSPLAPGVLPTGGGRVVLHTVPEPHGTTEVWASLTPAEARRLAALLLHQADAADTGSAA
ncbi:hypothetical protein [Kitasatospora sp. KL5]|uniref:hypothetical protein n=1 Tax=Kitasatospora sp. KL5 TaxID=3425125 RepID=UPI003D6ED915